MTSDRLYSNDLGLKLTIVGFLIRLAAIPSSILRINPFSQSDAVGFGQSAAATAQALAGQSPSFSPPSLTYQLWGGIISPFWLLPGPSGVYSRIALAAVGSLTIYNVYHICNYYHSKAAGVIATAPFLLAPSLVLSHPTFLREGTVLAGITTAARLLASPTENARMKAILMSLVALLIAGLLRYDNIPLYLVSISVGASVYLLESNQKAQSFYLSSAHGIASFGLLISGEAKRIIQYLSRIRESRAHGRTTYLVNLEINTFIEAIVFSWIGAAYFLFVPFPWMISTVEDFVVGVEGMINIVYALCAIWGVRIVFQSKKYAALGLLTYLVLGSILYGLVEVNVGAAVRHRMMFTWVLFAFGGIGIANKFSFRLQ